MNLVDSSGWLEYLADGPNAAVFEKPLKDIQNLIVPSLCLSEIFKLVLRERGENDALQAIALMRQGTVIDLTAEIALLAARISTDLQLPLFEGIILTTSQLSGATLWTQNSAFESVKGVKYVRKSWISR